MDVLEQAEADQSGEHGRSAVRDKWQRHSGHRHQPHGHADIFKGLEGEPADYPDTDQPPEEVVGSLGNQKSSPEKEAEEEQDQSRADKSSLFTCHGEDEVGLLLWYKATVGLWTIKETSADNSP